MDKDRGVEREAWEYKSRDLVCDAWPAAEDAYTPTKLRQGSREIILSRKVDSRGL